MSLATKDLREGQPQSYETSRSSLLAFVWLARIQVDWEVLENIILERAISAEHQAFLEAQKSGMIAQTGPVNEACGADPPELEWDRDFGNQKQE
jgi:hypothetical protein